MRTTTTRRARFGAASLAVLTAAVAVLALAPASEAKKGGNGKGKGKKCSAPLTLSVNDRSKYEDDEDEKPFVFRVRLSCRSDDPVTVDFETLDDTATAGEDYTETIGSRTFKPGQKNKVVKVWVKGDLDVEEDETFTLEVSDADGVLDGVSGTGTIKNDD